MQNKTYMRSVCRKKRRSVSDSSRKSAAASELLLKFKKIIEADTVLLYASIGSEMKSYYLINKLLSIGKKVALPRCHDNGLMTFHVISSIEELIIGKYDIPEPPENAPSPVITSTSVCIVPGLAFTEKGDRLGYGGGYYDRFFAANPNIYRIGITFEELIVPKLPILSHDLKVDAVVTDERMVLCCAE